MKNLKRFLLNFWIHICIHIDTNLGDLTLSVNGELPFSLEAKELSIQTPKNIKQKLLLGLSDDGENEGGRQFIGSVTNINLFANTVSKI